MVYTVKETAGLLKTHIHVIYKLIEDGELKAKKIGTLKVSQKEIERFLEGEAWTEGLIYKA